jgi:ferric-dicitrate binding protein FerR (iron transport regulator)
MTSEPDFDQTLRQGFEGIREADARQAPDFSLMMARARADAAATAAAAPTVTATPAAADVRWFRSAKRLLAVGAPLAAAAALALWFRPVSAADREFEQAVADWSRTAASTATSPTDGLLSVPGSEFLRGSPMDGTDPRTPRRGS